MVVGGEEGRIAEAVEGVGTEESHEDGAVFCGLGGEALCVRGLGEMACEDIAGDAPSDSVYQYNQRARELVMSSVGQPALLSSQR